MRSEIPSSDSVSAAAYDADQSVVTEENHRDRSRSRRHRQHNYTHHESEEETEECSSNSDDSSFNAMCQSRTRDQDGHEVKGSSSSSSNKHHPTKGDSSLPSAKKNNDLEQEGTGVCCQKKYIAAAILAVALLACAIGGILLFTGGARGGSSSGSSQSSAFDFASLTESPTAQPTISPKPSPEPTTRSPTRHPTPRPTPRPTDGPTQSPTKRPTLNPTPVPPPPTVPPPTVRGHDTFSFYVMGDVPYSDAEEKILQQQLKDIDRIAPMDDAQFIVHVGDVFKRSRYECIPKTYQNVADKFIELSPIPTIVLPGDNDIYDCDDWREAEQLWESTFLNFEQNWSHKSNFPATVLRQERSQENFSFTYADVLFVGMNIIASSEGETKNKQDDRFDACMEWMEDTITAHVQSSSDLRAVVFFGHADKFNEIFERAEKLLAHTKVPALYIHGNGHVWEMEKPINGWDEYLRIQVDQGGEAPPLKVTIRGTTAEALASPFYAPFSDQHMHTSTIRLDRQGGRYSDN